MQDLEISTNNRCRTQLEATTAARIKGLRGGKIKYNVIDKISVSFLSLVHSSSHVRLWIQVEFAAHVKHRAMVFI